mmetsp:Transcript_3755/g.9842  ORF Transcript_3755/g.9842 Transcript_3755/m.9842 type:complete len:319 (+) Transcript_3755:240-1196(+)
MPLKMKIKKRCSLAFFILFSPLLSIAVFGRRHSMTFLAKKSHSAVSSSVSPVSLRSKTQDVSTFPSKRHVEIIPAHVSTSIIATKLYRGGYQHDDDNYYDHRGKRGNNDDYYSKQYNDDNYSYDDRGPSYDDRRKDKRLNPSSFSMPDIISTGNRKIGIPLLAIGGALTILGVSLFFNKTLMRLGNFFFVAGVPMTLGPGRTAGYFFQPKKARATACLVAGVMLVFVGWPIFGIILEAFGLLNLFGNMFPMALVIMKQMPVIGPLLKGNVVSNKKKDERFGSSNDWNDEYDSYQEDRDRDSYYNERGYPYDDDNNRYY